MYVVVGADGPMPVRLSGVSPVGVGVLFGRMAMGFAAPLRSERRTSIRHARHLYRPAPRIPLVETAELTRSFGKG